MSACNALYCMIAVKSARGRYCFLKRTPIMLVQLVVTIPAGSLWLVEVAVKGPKGFDIESISSATPRRLSISVLLSRPSCVLPPSDGEGRPGNVSEASGLFCQRSFRKSLHENTCFMLQTSVITASVPPTVEGCWPKRKSNVRIHRVRHFNNSHRYPQAVTATYDVLRN